MPLLLDDDLAISMYSGTIKRLFKNCPKPDGWFGCFFSPDNGSEDIRLTGVYPKFQLNELKEGSKYNIIVQESQNAKYEGYDLKHISLIPSPEHLAKILSGVKGIGKTTITKLIDNFGDDAINVIKNEPDKLIDIGISSKKIVMMQNCLNNSINKKRLDMMKVAPNLSINMIDYIFDESGRDIDWTAKDFIKKACTEPYELMYLYPKLTFSMVDEIAMHNNYNPSSTDRIAAALFHCIHVDYKAYVYIDVNNDFDEFASRVCQILNKNRASFVSVIDVKRAYKEIFIDKTARMPASLILVGSRLYELDKQICEKSVAASVYRMVKSSPVIHATLKEIDDKIEEFELLEGHKLDDFQKNAVRTAIQNRLCTISGGPGRGKSSVAKCILYVFEALSHRRTLTGKPHLCAPTGKACNRLAEATGRNNVKTLASFYGKYRFFSHENTRKGKQFMNSLLGNLVIIDESSMVGLGTAKDVFEMFEDCQIVFMGDFDQLPSIEYGQFFKDLYESRWVPKAKLYINHRSTGIIVANADLINTGTHVEYMQLTTDNTFSFYNYEMRNADAATHIMNDFVSVVDDPDEDVKRYNLISSCILAPMSKGPGGVAELNAKLQKALNPNGTDVPELTYTRKGIDIVPKIGDRIIYTTNVSDAGYIYVSGPNQGEIGTGISNGDCGFLTECKVESSGITVTIVTDDGKKYSFNLVDCVDSIELAYAMSIHKSQGSEYENVFISCQPELLYTPKGFASRNLMYTAVTRAKTHCSIYGSLAAMNMCIDTTVADRNSYLVELIDELCA